MASYENFKVSLGCLEFQMDLRRNTGVPRVHLKLHDTGDSSEEELSCEKCTADRIWLIHFSFVLRKGAWVISKSTEIFEELELSLDH